MQRALLALALLALPLAGCAAPPPSASAAPGWSFTDTEGVQHSNGTAAGKPTLLFFMASWCSSCRSKTPFLAEVHGEYGERVNFFTVSYDTTDTTESLRAWKERYSQPWPHGIDPGFNIQRTFGIVSQSSFVLLDPEGGVERKWSYGQGNAAEFRAAFERALAA